jgi:DnaK suppressor protein
MSTTATLTRQQLRELEAELRRERVRLERTLAAADGANNGTGVLSSDVAASYASTSPDSAIGVMVETRSHARYQSIVAALERIASATYGTCAGCANPIPYGRLLVMPEATHCVRCGIHG